MVQSFCSKPVTNRRKLKTSRDRLSQGSQQCRMALAGKLSLNLGQFRSVLGAFLTLKRTGNDSNGVVKSGIDRQD